MSGPTAGTVRGADAFQAAWTDFLGKVMQYNSAQRQQIYQSVVHSFQEILATSPAPRAEGRDPVPPLSPTAAERSSDARATKQLLDVELVVADKLYQVAGATRHGQRALFQKYDVSKAGSLSSQEFKAAIASLGITLSDRELTLLLQKYDLNGDGRLSYDEFIKFISARREAAPRSSSQDAYSGSMHGRSAARAAEVSEMVRGLEAPFEVRLARGMKAMRDNIYLKSQTLYPLFKQLQNDQKQVTINGLVSQMPKYGFPAGLVTEDQLREVASSYSETRPGFLTYPEFNAFISGNERVEDDQKETSKWASNPNLMAVLVTVNNQPLRKVFRTMDLDQNGLISTAELMTGLTHYGLSPFTADDESFRAFAETFCKRQSGQFGFSEFNRFINQRKHGQATKIAGEPLHKTVLTIPAGQTLAEIMDALRRYTHDEGISVETVLESYDRTGEGALSNEGDLLAALTDMGVMIDDSSVALIWNTLVAQGEALDIAEFARAISNPLRNSKLTSAVAASGGRTIRVTPGGESTVPLGAYADDVKDKPSRPLTRGVGQGGEQSFDFKMGPSEWVPPRAVPSKRNQSEINLTTEALPTDRPQTAPPRNRPPGGQSMIDFANDHGASMARDPAKIKAPPGGHSSVVFGTESNAPVTPTKHSRRRGVGGTPGGESSITYGTPKPGDAEPLPSPRPMKTYHGLNQSTVSMNHQDFEDYKPGLKRVGPAGGPSTIDLTFNPNAAMPPPPARAVDGDPNFTLEFNPMVQTNIADSGRVSSRGRQAGGGAATIQLSHPTRAHTTSAEASPQAPRTKGGRGAAPASSLTNLGNDASAQLLAQYSAEAKDHDFELLNKVSDVIYARGRLRPTFQELTKGTSSTITKPLFTTGMQMLGLTLTPEQVDSLFERFDADHDGELTYSEFVRMVATSDRQPGGSGAEPAGAAAPPAATEGASTANANGSGAATTSSTAGNTTPRAGGEVRMSPVDRPAAGFSGASPRAIRPTT